MISPDIIQQLYGKWQEMVNREDGFCLKQETVEEKSNEITAIPELLCNKHEPGRVFRAGLELLKTN